MLYATLVGPYESGSARHNRTVNADYSILSPESNILQRRFPLAEPPRVRLALDTPERPPPCPDPVARPPPVPLDTLPFAPVLDRVPVAGPETLPTSVEPSTRMRELLDAAAPWFREP